MNMKNVDMTRDMDDMDKDIDKDMDKLHEECGVFGIYDRDGYNVARETFFGLYSLQHRGQESAGIAVCDNGVIVSHKDMGLVPEVFNDVILNHLKGQSAIGHVRYSTSGESLWENAQPLVVKHHRGQLALAHNGNLVNAVEIRERLENEGVVFQSTIDSEVIANLLSRYMLTKPIEEAIGVVMDEIRGAYALTLLTPKKLIGVRDPYGLRPLCLGKLNNSYILASESCAIDVVGGEFIRDVNPGEIVIIDETGLRSIQKEVKQTALCIFEYIYFARPDSIIDGASVDEARIEMGRRLAKEHPVEADLIIGVPDSGVSAAIGYSRESGIPYGQGLMKNRYVGRTFIRPEQGQRETGVRIKLNAMRNAVKGKRIVLVDDSIVRGTTSKRIVQMLRDAGAKEVHMRISSPPFIHSCYFGVDVTSSKQLVASNYSVDEVCKMIGADSLGYLSLEGLLKCPVGAKCGFCTGCFTGEYPMEVPMELPTQGSKCD